MKIPDCSNSSSVSRRAALQSRMTYIVMAILMIAGVAALCGCNRNPVRTPDYILQLDSLIQRNTDFEREKLLHIADMPHYHLQTYPINTLTIERNILNISVFVLAEGGGEDCGL